MVEGVQAVVAGGWMFLCVGAGAQVVPGLQCAGATAVSIHGRTQQQRYTKAADWDCISSIASAHKVPIIGNGVPFLLGFPLNVIADHI